uniref:Uncharacterized protein n=1 Tax=Rhizophora mucronata TaxID=61149 RepID=A0A2P2QGW5_RHIMU
MPLSPTTVKSLSIHISISWFKAHPSRTSSYKALSISFPNKTFSLTFPV